MPEVIGYKNSGFVTENSSIFSGVVVGDVTRLRFMVVAVLAGIVVGVRRFTDGVLVVANVIDLEVVWPVGLRIENL